MKKKSIRNVLLFLFVIFLFYHLVSYCGYGNIIEGAFIRPSQSVNLRALKLEPGMKYSWNDSPFVNEWSVSGFKNYNSAVSLNTYLCPYDDDDADSTWLKSPDKIDNMSGFRYCKNPIGTCLPKDSSTDGTVNACNKAKISNEHCDPNQMSSDEEIARCQKNNCENAGECYYTPPSKEPAFTCPTGYFCAKEEGCTKCRDCTKCLAKTATPNALNNMKNNVGIESIELKRDPFANGTGLYNTEIVIEANQTGDYVFQFINEDRKYENASLTVDQTLSNHDVDFYTPFQGVTNVSWERSLTGNPVESAAAGTVATGKAIGEAAVAVASGVSKGVDSVESLIKRI